jgi:hypothetical protein
VTRDHSKPILCAILHVIAVHYQKKMSTIEIQRCWRGRMARSLANRLRQRNINFDRRVVQDRESEVAALREQRVKDMVRDIQIHPIVPMHTHREIQPTMALHSSEIQPTMVLHSSEIQPTMALHSSAGATDPSEVEHRLRGALQ